MHPPAAQRQLAGQACKGTRNKAAAPRCPSMQHNSAALRTVHTHTVHVHTHAGERVQAVQAGQGPVLRHIHQAADGD